MQRVLWNRSRLHNPGEGKECASSSSGTVGSAASGLIAVPPGACMRRRGRRGSECGTAGGQLSLAARGGNAQSPKAYDVSDPEGLFPFQPVEEVPRLLGHLSGLVRNQKLLTSQINYFRGLSQLGSPESRDGDGSLGGAGVQEKGLDTGHAESEFADAVGCMVVWSQLGFLPGLVRSAVKCVYFIVHQAQNVNYISDHKSNKLQKMDFNPGLCDSQGLPLSYQSTMLVYIAQFPYSNLMTVQNLPIQKIEVGESKITTHSQVSGIDLISNGVFLKIVISLCLFSYIHHQSITRI